MEYENVAIIKELEEEIENLKSVLGIVSQLEREQAKRIIMYAWRYLENLKEISEDLNVTNTFVNELIKKKIITTDK